MTVPHAAYLFDLDGTLLDTLSDIGRSVNHVRSTYGLAPWPADAVRAAVGHGIEHLVRQCLVDAPFDPDETRLEEALSRYRVHHLANLVVDTVAYPGVTEGLERLVHGGARIAVVSNKSVDYCERLVARFFPQAVDLTLGGDSVVQKKPSPDMLLLALESLGVEPRRAVMVGDSVSDLAAGRAAGCAESLAVAWGFRPPAELAPHADRLIERFAELLGAPV